MTLEEGKRPLESLIAEHAPFLERLARGIVGDRDRAADLIQETWAVALRRPDVAETLVADRGGARRWLAVVFRRRRAHEARQAALRRTSPIADETSRDEPPVGPDEVAIRLERQRLLQDALARLPEPYRSTLVYRYQDGASAAEIARRTGQAPSTVRSQVSRGLDQLRGILDRNHPGGRAEWLAALAPLAYPRGLVNRASAALPNAPSLIAFMTMNKLLLVVPLVALLVLALWSEFAGSSVSRTTTGVNATVDPLELTRSAKLDGPIDDTPTARIASGERRRATTTDDANAETVELAVSDEDTTEIDAASGSSSDVISGRAVLMDGTPVPDQTVNVIEFGNRVEESATTGEDGRFEITGLGGGSYRINVNHRKQIEGSTLSDVTPPATGLELRLDAILLEAMLPDDIERGEIEGGGSRIVMAFGPAELPFGSVAYAGLDVGERAALVELLPAGPGYFISISQGDRHWAALFEEGLVSGAYRRPLESASPNLAEVEFVLTGAELKHPQRVTPSFDWWDGHQWRNYASTGSFTEAERQIRVRTLLPGRYRIKLHVFGPPPASWCYAVARATEFEVEAGDSALVEIEVRTGGGIALTIDASQEGSQKESEEVFELGFRTPSSATWARHLTYRRVGENFQTTLRHAPDTLYRSFEPIPAGPTTFRITGDGYRTVEETLEIRAGQLTEWNPRLERLPD